MAKRPSLVAAALALAWLALAADVLYGGPVSHLDTWLADRLQAPPRSPLALAMIFWTNLHSYVALLAYSVLLMLLLARRRAWTWVAGVALAVPGAVLVNYALQLAVARTRPVLDNPILALNTASFPSGHAAAAVAFYGMLGAYLAARFPRCRGLFFGLAALLVALAAGSRVALGLCYFGDTLGAALATGAWLVACLGALEAGVARLHIRPL